MYVCAVERSCNVALMKMGQTIGKTTFLKYMQDFNFGLKTNIDLYGEARTASLVFTEDSMGPMELATASFGQGFNVTMIQMAAGFSSLINGGYYYEPHMVSKITASDGSVVQNIEPRLLKQTVSESTSAKIRDYCVDVVMGEHGTGHTQGRPATSSAERPARRRHSPEETGSTWFPSLALRLRMIRRSPSMW